MCLFWAINRKHEATMCVVTVGNGVIFFSTGGGQRAAGKFEVPFLGSIPIDPAIRQGGDAGTPIVIADPSSAQSKVFKEIATRLDEMIGQPSSDGESKNPSLSQLLKKIKAPLGTN